MATIYDLQDRLTAARQRLSTLNPPKNEFTRRREYESNPVLRQAMDEVSALQAAYDQEYAKFGPGQMPFQSARAGGALSPQPGALTIPQPPSSPAVSAVQPMAPARTPQQDMIGDMDASSVSNPSPIIQAMLNQAQNQPQASYDMPDVQQELRVAQATPVSGPDPFAETYNKTASAFQGALKSAQDSKSDYGWADALIDAGRGLMIAGSPDPAKAAASFADAWANERAGRKPKVTPLADGAFSMVTKPDGTFEIVRNDQIADYLGEQQQAKFEQALAKTVLGGRVQAQVAADRAAIKTAEENRPLLNDTTGLIGRWKEAQTIVQNQATNAPTSSKLQGLAPGIAGFFGGDQVAANKFLQGLAVDETLLNTARTKGAISDTEMKLFKSPLPALGDDREKVWKPFIEKRIAVLEKLQKFYEGEVSRGAPGAAPAPPAPAPANTGGMSVPGLSPNASKYFFNR